MAESVRCVLRSSESSVLGEMPCPGCSCGCHSQGNPVPSPLLTQLHCIQAEQDSAAHPVSTAMTRADVPGCGTCERCSTEESIGAPRDLLLQDPSAGRMQPSYGMSQSIRLCHNPNSEPRRSYCTSLALALPLCKPSPGVGTSLLIQPPDPAQPSSQLKNLSAFGKGKARVKPTAHGEISVAPQPRKPQTSTWSTYSCLKMDFHAPGSTLPPASLH